MHEDSVLEWATYSVLVICTERFVKLQICRALETFNNYDSPLSILIQDWLRAFCIMEYGSTPYVGMARKKMAAACTLYKLIRSEAITMTQTRKSGNFTGVLHSYHSVFKEIELVQQCSRALSSGRLPFPHLDGVESPKSPKM